MSKFIKPCDGRVTSPFGERIHPITKTKKMHWGVDYGNTPSDNTIVASADGTVDRASEFEGYGDTIIITHKINGVTYQTLYAHLESMCVEVGDKVKQGEKIGVKGTTGNSTGIHLHFEVHKGGKRNSKYTNAVDPALHVADPDALAAQQLLNKNGYKLIEDGINGEATEKATTDFQKKNGLDADGIAGDKTIAKLKSSIKAVKSVTTKKPETTKKAEEAKIMWGKTELKKGQIGKITVIKPINLWTDDKDGKLVKSRILGVGEEYRVYGYRPNYQGQYGLGDGLWVTRMPAYIKYETPSKKMLAEIKAL